MTREDELNPSAIMIEHGERAHPFEPADGDMKVIKAVSGHIGRHLGPVDMVFHEKVSDLVHIDLHWLKPRPDRPYNTLVTSGMSQRPMKVPEGAEAFAYTELVLNLPADWPMMIESWRDDANFWPIRLLKTLARFPHEQDTWLCMGHTIGESGKPYGPGTRQCAALIAPCISAPKGFFWLSMADKTIGFLSVIPLYPEELEFKRRMGLDALYGKLEEAGVGDCIAPDRPSACPPARPRGILGWFRPR